MFLYTNYLKMTIVKLYFILSCANEKLYDNYIIYLFSLYITIKTSCKQKISLNKNELRQLGSTKTYYYKPLVF